MRKILISKNNIFLIGALTSKPYSFKSRPWELKYLETIDFFDSLGSNIKINYKGSSIYRVLPSLNERINEEWITDKTRFAYDGLTYWRFINPVIKKNGSFISKSWKSVFSEINMYIKDFKISNFEIYSGPYVSVESLIFFKAIALKKNNINFSGHLTKNVDFKSSFLIDSFKINPNIKSSQCYLLLNINLRIENPLLNLKLRKLSKKRNVLIAYIGSSYKNTFYSYHLGNNFLNLKQIFEGKSWFSVIISNFFKNTLKNKKNIMIIKNEFLENNKLNNKYNSSFLNLQIVTIAKDLGTINSKILNFSKAIVNVKNKPTLRWYLGKEFSEPKKNDLIIFQGHHYLQAHKKVDIILPTTTFFESKGSYFNLFGHIQVSNSLACIYKNPREDWQIIKMFSKFIFGINVSINSLTDISLILDKYRLNYMTVKKSNFFTIEKWNKMLFYFSNKNSKLSLTNYYLTDSITKSSKIMTECSKHFYFNKNIYTWT